MRQCISVCVWLCLSSLAWQHAAFAQQPVNRPMSQSPMDSDVTVGPMVSPMQSSANSGRAGPPMASPATYIDKTPVFDGEGNVANKDTLYVRLRVMWGGKAPKSWTGRLSLESGRFARLTSLSMEANSSAVIEESRTSILIKNVGERSYDGFDVFIAGSVNTKVMVELVDEARKMNPVSYKLAVTEILTTPFQRVIDEEGNRIKVRRSPGDQIRVQLQRNNLVFSPGESLVMNVQPYAIGLRPSQQYQLDVNVMPYHSSDVINTQSIAFNTIANQIGNTISNVTVPIPHKPGIYNIDVSVRSSRFVDSLVRLTPIAQRRMQFVVAPTQHTRSESRPELVEVMRFDPTDVSWWDKFNALHHLDRLNVLAGVKIQPQSNGKTSTLAQANGKWVALEKAESDNKLFTSIGVSGWQSYPLHCEDLYQPHVLEVVLPSGIQQSVGISILEPDASGSLHPVHRDFGFFQDSTRWINADGQQVQSIVFWPRTQSPVMLLTNHHPSKSAVFKEVIVKQVLGNLGDLNRQFERSTINSRDVLAMLEKPLFPELFGVSGALDEISRAVLDDWHTFYSSSKRLTDYLEYAGYSGASVAVVCEGSTLYPTAQISSTPKYESGALLSSGQDPVQKDVVELLFKMFDARGLKLVPSIQFNMPLAQLDVLTSSSDGMEGVLLRDGVGRTWNQRFSTNRGLGPYYNPLNVHVQKAMIDIVREMVDRYGHHPSFGGVMVAMTPNGYTHFPSSHWGQDTETVSEFMNHLKAGGTDSLMSHQQSVQAINGELRQQWLTWRSQKLSEFYSRIAATVQEQVAGAKLYLSPGELFNDPLVKRQLQPRLAVDVPFDEVMLEKGIKPNAFPASSSLVWMHPNKCVPIHDLSKQSSDVTIQRDARFSRWSGTHMQSATVIQHTPHSRSLPGFDKVSPFGAGSANTWLINTLAATHGDARKPFIESLVNSDTFHLLQGGWLLPFGSESSLRDMFETIKRLPKDRFQTVRLPDSVAKSPITLRELRLDDVTYYYLLNNSPWSVGGAVELKVEPSARINLLAQQESRLNRMPLATNPQGRQSIQWNRIGATWSFDLKPYDIVAVKVERGVPTVADVRVTVDEAIAAKIQKEIREVNRRVSNLTQPRHMQVLQNSGFEATQTHLFPNGWVHNASAKNKIQTKTGNAFHGQQHLVLHRRPADRDVTWVRSEPFAPPATGRIAVSAWVRIPDESQQPSFRIAVEGKLYGQVYYRPRTIGRKESGQQARNITAIGEKWSRFVLILDDLPKDGLSELRVGFDLMSAGEVWIDQVEVFDIWFQQQEFHGLIKDVALVYSLQEHGNLLECEEYLQSYWPRYLQQYVPLGLSRVANVPDELQENRETGDTASPTNVLDLFRQHIPDQLLPF